MILTAFYLSGLSALVYEISWSRILTLIFGASVYGQSIILALFMGGMALGARFIGYKLKNAQRPLIWYGVLEGLIALFGFISTYIDDFTQAMEGIAGSSIAIKIVFCSFFILPPTFLMGGTFPALYKHLKDQLNVNNSALKDISRLYTVNTFGALCGIFLCNYFFLVTFGVKGSIYFACLINFLIFVCVFIFSRFKDISIPEVKSGMISSEVHTSKKVLFSLFLSGFLTMLYEISWSRALNFSFGSSTFTFSLIIFSFITGLSLGSLWIKNKNISDKKKYPALISELQTRAWIFAVIFTFISARMPLITNYMFTIAGDSFIKLHLLETLILFILVTPVAFCSGASFPLLCALSSNSKNPSENDFGIALSFNTFGSITGALITGFLFMKYFGPFNIIWISFILHLLIIVQFSLKCSLKERIPHAFVLLLGIFVLFIHFHFFERLDLLTGNYAKLYSGKADRYIPEYLQNNPSYWKFKKLKMKTPATQRELLWFKHGLISTVSIVKNNKSTSLLLDGKPDASIGNFYESDMPTQSLLAFFPLIFSPQNNSGLVVGYGSGVTAGILSQYFKKIDCLEIEPKVLDASKYFSKYNFQDKGTDNLNIILGDARTYIRNTSAKYDFISAEPSNIWMAGVAHLFSKEYFQDCYDILNDEGVMVQWIHVYKLSLYDFKLALNTFMSAFKYVEVWGSFNYGDIFIIGYKKGKKTFTKANYEKMLDNYVYSKEMKMIKAGKFEDFKKFRISSNSDYLNADLKNIPIHSDDMPILEFSTGKNMFKTEMNEIYKYLEKTK